MEFIAFVASPPTGQSITLKPDPRQHPASAVSVPEGGSTLLFVLAVLTAIGWAASKRYCARIGENATSAPTAR
jgi:hypothetical protein